MSEYHEIRAVYDKDTITVYQAYNKSIATAAAKNNKFVEPFSFNRMTWIKPSFLWMMERSGWGRKANQEHTLAIRLTRTGFEKALSEAVLTSPKKDIYKTSEEWNKRKKHAKVVVQWDPERDIRGQKLEYRSIQIGISRHLIEEFNDEWIVGIDDISDLVKKIHALKVAGHHDKAKQFLPKERVYELPPEISHLVGIR